MVLYSIFLPYIFCTFLSLPRKRINCHSCSFSLTNSRAKFKTLIMNIIIYWELCNFSMTEVSYQSALYLLRVTRSVILAPSTSTLSEVSLCGWFFSFKCKYFKNKTLCNYLFSVLWCLFSKICSHNTITYQNLTTNLLSVIICAASYWYPASALQASEGL